PQWKDHLYSLDHLKEGIGLRGYGQRDPLVEYKKESYNMFQALMDRIDEEILRWVFLYQPVPVQEQPVAPDQEPVDDLPPFEGTPPWKGGGGSRGGASGSPRVKTREPELALAGARSPPRNLTFHDPTEGLSGSGGAGRFAGAEPKEAHGGSDEVQTVRREGPKVGRNDACPAGGGGRD